MKQENEQERDSFGMSFNSYKIRYAEYDKSLEASNFLSQQDKVNVFVNFETILRSLSGVRDIDKKIFSTRDFSKIMIANTINMAAHYRKFFRGNGLPVRVFLYCTHLKSVKFNESDLNEDFRSYYLVKYTKNPKYAMLGDLLTEEIFPYVTTITDHLPGVYFIQSNGIDSSLVPLIIANSDPTWKNVMITGEYVDTQFSLIPGFLCHYLRRGINLSVTSSNLEEHLKSMLKKEDGKTYEEELKYYQNPSFYSMLFACIGDHYRNVEGINGMGNYGLLKYLDRGIREHIIAQDTRNIDSILPIFPEEMKSSILTNFGCINFPSMARKLSTSQIQSVMDQLIDRTNNVELMRINNKDFIDHPLMLQELTM